MDNRKGDEYYLGEVIENINVILPTRKIKIMLISSKMAS